MDTVLINDEIASAPKGHEEDRRGTTADHIIIKMAGAAAQGKSSLKEVVRIARNAVHGSRSLGVGLSSCTLPATGKEIFQIGDDEMEIGIGLHGEPGVGRTKLLSADETVEKIIPIIIEDLPYRSGDEIILILNSYCGTTRMELFIVNRKIRQMLLDYGISVYATEVGAFCTSQEMKGISITFVKVDDELRKLYCASCRTPFYTKQETLRDGTQAH